VGYCGNGEAHGATALGGRKQRIGRSITRSAVRVADCSRSLDRFASRAAAAAQRHSVQRDSGQRSRKAGSANDCPTAYASRIRGCPATDEREFKHCGEKSWGRAGKNADRRADGLGVQNQKLHQGRAGSRTDHGLEPRSQPGEKSAGALRGTRQFALVRDPHSPYFTLDRVY